MLPVPRRVALGSSRYPIPEGARIIHVRSPCACPVRTPHAHDLCACFVRIRRAHGFCARLMRILRAHCLTWIPQVCHTPDVRQPHGLDCEQRAPLPRTRQTVLRLPAVRGGTGFGGRLKGTPHRGGEAGPSGPCSPYSFARGCAIFATQPIECAGVSVPLEYYKRTDAASVPTENQHGRHLRGRDESCMATA
jgi:hypothetical protein